MIEFFRNMFLLGLQVTSENFMYDYLLNTIYMLLVCLGLVYLVALILLSLFPLYRSDITRPLVDTDTRIKLCAGWAAELVFFGMVSLLFWIWFRWWNPAEGDSGFFLRPWASHWTVLIVLFIVWVIVYTSMRSDYRRAQQSTQSN